LKESYKSLHESLIHGGIANHAKVNVVYIDSETLTEKNSAAALAGVHAILVPGGFGERGVDGKMAAIRYARENQVPFFGICFGMQLAAIEFARNVCGIRDASSREFEPKSERNLVIDFMEEQRGVKQKGGTMRLVPILAHWTKAARSAASTVSLGFSNATATVTNSITATANYLIKTVWTLREYARTEIW
jgi:CTP synthase